MPLRLFSLAIHSMCSSAVTILYTHNTHLFIQVTLRLDRKKWPVPVLKEAMDLLEVGFVLYYSLRCWSIVFFFCLWNEKRASESGKVLHAIPFLFFVLSWCAERRHVCLWNPRGCFMICCSSLVTQEADRYEYRQVSSLIIKFKTALQTGAVKCHGAGFSLLGCLVSFSFVDDEMVCDDV